jgi:1-acyl-sn-glycerol-3-phosphate acyltransferase
MTRGTNVILRRVSKRYLEWFSRYVNWYLPRNFHGLHLLRLADLKRIADMPLLVCLNHPSWWDPLVALHLSRRFFPDRYHVAPIAAEGLSKYKFFERLGFFSVDPGTHSDS